MTTGFPPFPPGAGSCPFCGVVTDVPHETQEGCIEALHVEIARMRGILDHLRPLGSLNPRHEQSEDTGV
jgi:hypothetical protein